MSTPGYRFLASPRWLGIIAGGIVAMALCAFLAQWQYGRYEERAAANDRVTAAADSQPRALSEVLPPGSGLAEDDQWTLVTATGTFDAANQIFLRGRTVDGNTGWEVVVPLVLPDGRAVLVDRGWVPQGDKGATHPPDVAPVPSGEVTVDGRIRPPETAIGEIAELNGALQTRRLNPELIGGALPYPVLAGYMTPDEPEEGFKAIPVPEQRSWQNFAYAYQWWLFAALIPIGLVILARKEKRGDSKEALSGDRVDGGEPVRSGV
ncbi:SURF1 family protein [Phytomonospora sp. NPDC050363]|uniref:SURF1 family cytochrome oxidase biogenesis protein n=1 Tax=Phytomonospora sp. NPDC050363 TaxID=3155642 RepID=UPI0033F85EDD